MGYGLGGTFLVIGLILALAVQDNVQGVDLTMIGWILAAVGLVMLLLTAVTLNGRRHSRTVQTTVHPDGSETVNERRSQI